MSKKIKFIIIPLIILLIIFLSFILLNRYNKAKEKRLNENRYNEIRKSVEKAVKWNIGAMYPNCEISDGFKDLSGTHYNSSFLINNGYIKKEELLDIDNKSYCDVYVDIGTEYKDKLDHQRDCKIYYKIYLKCNEFADKGYINWDEGLESRN